MSRLRGNSVWLALISGTLFFSLLSFSGYVASLPFIKQEWGLSNTQAGLIFSSFLVGFAVSSLILVPMADRVPPGRMMVLGVAVMTFSHLLFPLLARGFWTAVSLRFLAGSGQVMAYILGIRLVSERFDERHRGAAVGLFVSTGYAGTTLSYTLVGLLLNQVPTWRTAYLVTAFLGFVGLALALVTARATVSFESESPPVAGEEPAAAPTLRALDLAVLRHRPIVLVIIAYALHTAELYLARLWLPLLLGAALVVHGASAADATAAAATWSGLMFMTGILGAFSGGLLSDRLGRAAGAILVFSVSGVCSFLIGWLVEAPLFFPLALGFVYGFATAADSAIYSTAAVELSPPGRVASVQAIQSFIGFGVGAVVPVVAGSILDLADPASGWRLAFGFNGLLAVGGIAALLWLRRLGGTKRPAYETAAL